MDPWWVRCGNCFSFASLFSSTVIYLTSCGHFVCNHCLRKSPIPNPANTGYCYDCKKVCSVVNLSQKDKLSPEITFYFKDPVSVFQKIIEVENFQKLHRDRCMENVLCRQLMEEIAQMKALRERTEKYLPCLEHIYKYLCTKYNIKPRNQHADYSPAEIAAFVEEMKEVKKRLYPSSRSQTPDTAMEIEKRTTAFSTPSSQGVFGLVGGGLSTGKGDPQSQRTQLFRTRVQNEMRGDAARGTLAGCSTANPCMLLSAAQTTTPTSSNITRPSPLLSAARTTTPTTWTTSPTSSNATKPSPLLTAARTTTPTGSNKARPSPRLSATRTTTPTGPNKPSPLLSSSRAVAPAHSVQLPHLVPGHATNSSAGALQPFNCTPPHTQIRQLMMSGDAGQSSVIPMAAPIMPSSAGQSRPRFAGIPMMVGPRQAVMPVGLSPRPSRMPMSLIMHGGRGVGGGTMTSSVQRMPARISQQSDTRKELSPSPSSAMSASPGSYSVVKDGLAKPLSRKKISNQPGMYLASASRIH